jgi:NADH:ubiquinone oxidoreductase subunit 3 (subunit A)
LLFVALSGLILIVVLILGLIHEWNQGALNWIL